MRFLGAVRVAQFVADRREQRAASPVGVPATDFFRCAAASFRSPSSIATCALLDAGIDARPRSRFDANAASSDFVRPRRRSSAARRPGRSPVVGVRASSESDAPRSDATEGAQAPSRCPWVPRRRRFLGPRIAHGALPSQAVASLASAAVSASNAVKASSYWPALNEA